jgi:hypothetical protein
MKNLKLKLLFSLFVAVALFSLWLNSPEHSQVPVSTDFKFSNGINAGQMTTRPHLDFDELMRSLETEMEQTTYELPKTSMMSLLTADGVCNLYVDNGNGKWVLYVPSETPVESNEDDPFGAIAEP